MKIGKHSGYIWLISASIGFLGACGKETEASVPASGGDEAITGSGTAGKGGTTTATTAGQGGTGTSAAQGGKGGDGIDKTGKGGSSVAQGGKGGNRMAQGGKGGNVGSSAGKVASSSGGAGGVAPAAGAGGKEKPADTCVKGQVKASEVVFIGESFVAAGTIPADTSALARQAGTIGANESYRSYAVSGTQLTTGEIPSQFAQAVADGPVKVVLMDGGGNDLLWGGRCANGVDAGCTEVVTVVQTLFKTMKTDGVKDVVYFFYPDPLGIGASIKDAQDTLRPEMKRACDGAADVRCIWVDQRESWEGHYDTYTSDGIHPTAAGSQASAKQIWEAMVANCVAQ
jgi:lysophospholipase L1-like esterase